MKNIKIRKYSDKKEKNRFPAHGGKPVFVLLCPCVKDDSDMDITREKACLCALNRIFGFEPKTGLALIGHFGCASGIFGSDSKELEALLGPYSRFRKDITEQKVEEAADELESLKGKGIRFTGWCEDGYPELLKECADAPVGLYIRSATPDSRLWQKRRISVVGTRDISPYGREWCTRIVRQFAETAEKPAVISGLAIGIDICAHRTALDAGLPTIAVMATGPETVYPVRHTDFAERMAATPGCALVTDYPPGTVPLAVNFLRRNRIIAGLSEATLLIESKIRGGGMMTANLAFSYGREVYAVPGRIDDICSQGCNRLIGNKVAEAVTGGEELMKSLRMKNPSRSRKASWTECIRSVYGGRMGAEQTEAMVKVLTCIKKNRGVTLEELAEACGMTYSRTCQITGLLESDGFITVDILQRCSINANKQMNLSE